MRDSIASGKAVIEQVRKNQEELLPGNTSTLPPADYQGQVNAMIDQSINFGYANQPYNSVQTSISQSMHQLSTISKLNKKPLVSRQDLTSLRIQENIRLYNAPNVNLTHNNIFITT